MEKNGLLVYVRKSQRVQNNILKMTTHSKKQVKNDNKK